MSDVIEPAATGRAKCRRCQQKIEQGTWRFSERVPNPFGEGEATWWLHLACAAERRPEKLAAALEGFAGDVPDRERIERAIRDGVANPKLAMVMRAERSPTGRATCQECREKIHQGDLRVVVEREGEPMALAATSFVHARCAARHLGPAGLEDKIRRTSPALGDADLADLARALAGGAP